MNTFKPNRKQSNSRNFNVWYYSHSEHGTRLFQTMER